MNISCISINSLGRTNKLINSKVLQIIWHLKWCVKRIILLSHLHWTFLLPSNCLVFLTWCYSLKFQSHWQPGLLCTGCQQRQAALLSCLRLFAPFSSLLICKVLFMNGVSKSGVEASKAERPCLVKCPHIIICVYWT